MEFSFTYRLKNNKKRASVLNFLKQYNVSTYCTNVRFVACHNLVFLLKKFSKIRWIKLIITFKVAYWKIKRLRYHHHGMCIENYLLNLKFSVTVGLCYSLINVKAGYIINYYNIIPIFVFYNIQYHLGSQNFITHCFTIN